MEDISEPVRNENLKLRAQLAELQQQREQEKAAYEAKLAQEQNAGQQHVEAVKLRNQELESMKKNVMKLSRQLDEEVTKRDQVQAESQMLSRSMQDLSQGQSASGMSTQKPKSRSQEDDEQLARERGSQVSMKLMRVVDQWMRHRDLQQALLRGASINDQAFSTLVQALSDCASLQNLDLSQNLLTMDSCSDLCHIITTASQLSFVSLADNLFSLRSIGYFMTAVMERQNTKKLIPLDLLDLQGNEGLVAAAASPAPEALMRQLQRSLGKDSRLPPQGAELVAHVMRALWRFLHDTGHPQVQDARADDVAFHIMDKVTLRKMENALLKIMLLGVDGQDGTNDRPVTANLALTGHLDSALSSATGAAAPAPAEASLGSTRRSQQGADATKTRELLLDGSPSATIRGGGDPSPKSDASPDARAGRSQRLDIRDPFSDLKTAFEPPKEKFKTFNLKQIVNKNGVVLMNMLERLLEATEIDAMDVETEQTLLEFACNTGNIGLAKLCYRRGAKLAAKTKKGDTAFNIVTRNKRYDLMEFLHKYGVKINSADRDGRTALHVAAENNDTDGICRLIEWGADVNARDNGLRTPIHYAAGAGNMNATLLLLEVGADMNAKDAKLYTAAAHANMNSHFTLFDRLTTLGGRRHGQIASHLEASKSAAQLGHITVSSGMLKSSSLGRIGKVAVKSMPGPISPTPLDAKKK